MTADAWGRLQTAIAVLAVDPGLKGLVLRLRAGPASEALAPLLAALPAPQRRIHPAIPDTALFGGLDVAETLARGHKVMDPGLVAAARTLVLPMAERTSPGLAARLGAILDARSDLTLILLDEGAGPEEQAPSSLADRLAFHIDLEGLHWSDAVPRLPAPADLDAARAGRAAVTTTPEDAATLTRIAATFGIDSARAPLLALRTARALAALEGRKTVSDEDLQEAAALVFAPRATQMPAEDEAPPDEPPPDDPPQDDHADQDDGDSGNLPDDILVAAVQAALPQGLLDRLAAGPHKGGSGSGAGAKRKGNRRGRPLPPRAGRPGGPARIDVVATLRAAAPWQTLRRRARPEGPKVRIRTEDIRLKRTEDRSDRLLIFVVDASGSAAVARLSEAKGAVELLLAEAYARRDHVALIAFRGAEAETLLPPTRALVAAKNRLSALPGGGATPLAAGLVAAADLADQARRRGMSPAIACLTDGRANMALDGAASRAAAQDDTYRTARLLAAMGHPAVVIDTATRPRDDGRALAEALSARYLALPRSDARALSAAVDVSLAV